MRSFAKLLLLLLLILFASILCNFQVESSDLIAYGLIPEFIGRFPILVSLSSLTEDQLVEVIFHVLIVVFSCVSIALWRNSCNQL